MAIDRRQILLGLLGAACGGGAVRGEALQQRLYVSCRMDAAENASVACFDDQGRDIFATVLPARGHDITVRPLHDEIVVVARRPGAWFVVAGRSDGRVIATVAAPAGRHFYGHSAFSGDGRLLYLTENDVASGDGAIAVHDATAGYRRIGAFSSGGVGPHDIALMPDGRALAIANGGLRTHPDTGRETLNPDDMKPNLAVVELSGGAVLARHELDAGLRQLSIRHLAVRGDGTLAFGCQYQGSGDDAPPLIGTVSPSGALRLLEIDDDALFRMKNYVGSVCFDDTGAYLVATSPHGGAALVWDMANRRVTRSIAVSDVCGAAPQGYGCFLLASGNAGLTSLDAGGVTAVRPTPGWTWDNHMRALISDGRAAGPRQPASPA